MMDNTNLTDTATNGLEELKVTDDAPELRALAALAVEAASGV